MTRTATAALLAALAAGPALAQLAEEDAETVDPGVEDVEIVDPEVVATEPVEPEPEVEVVEVEPGMLEGLITASQIQDGPIHSIGDAYDEAAWAAAESYAYDEGYETIGEIEDVVLDRSGAMVGIIAEVGGFLGLGERSVMLPVEDIRLVAPDAGAGVGAGVGASEGVGFGEGEFAYVTRLTEEQLEGLEAIEGYDD